MTDDEYEKRAVELLSAEAGETLAWWWLSFCDPEEPEGAQFLGACLVRATGFFSATLVAHRLGCNQGGQVRGMGPIPLDSQIEDGWTERLLTKDECDEFDRIHDGEL
jgi:hypothetical protein